MSPVDPSPVDPSMRSAAGGRVARGLRRVLPGFALMAAIALPASGEEFSWQITGGMHRSDFVNTTETDTTSLGFAYYFQAVDDTQGPLAVTPFLSRSSDISFHARRVNSKSRYGFYAAGSPSGFVDFTDESAVYEVSGRYVWRESGWFAGGGIESWDLQDPELSFSVTDRDKEAFSVVFGKYLGRSTALQLSARTAKETNDSDPLPCSPPTSPFLPFFCPAISVDSEILTDEAVLSVRHVGGTAGLRYAVSGQFLYSDTSYEFSAVQLSSSVTPAPWISVNSGSRIFASYGTPVAFGSASSSFSLGSHKAFSVAGELFPTQRIRVRMGYTSFSDFRLFDDRIELATQWFFTRQTALEFAVARISLDTSVSGIEQDEALFRLTGRF